MDTAQFTIKGADKPDNQDACAVDPELGLVTVADGVTHCDGGGIASRIAVARFREHLESVPHIDRHAVRTALARAHDALLKDKRSLYTTFDAVVVQEDRLLHIHAGDSRIYLLRQNSVELLTVDQVEGRFLANALGIPRLKAVARSTPRTDDMVGVALMTDGVWGELQPTQVETMLVANGTAFERAAIIEDSLRDPPPFDDATLAIALF